MVTVTDGTPTSRRPAPLWRRLAALLYDLVFVALLCWLAAALITLAGGGVAEAGTLSSTGVLLGALLFNALYFCVSWARSGQTIGMKAWKLCLARPDGRRLGWAQSLLRLLLGLLATLPLGAGWLWMLWDRRKRPLQDILADSEVVQLS